MNRKPEVVVGEAGSTLGDLPRGDTAGEGCVVIQSGAKVAVAFGYTVVCGPFRLQSNYFGQFMRAERAVWAARAQAVLDGLAKPVGSLGRLEALGVQLCAAQQQCPPDTRARVVVFAADHGVALENVSPFPSAVTHSMVTTILKGQATVSALSRNAQAMLELVNVGVATPVDVKSVQIAPVTEYVDALVSSTGTNNIAESAAMTTEQLEKAIQVGRDAIQRALQTNVGVVCIGELGIANTTPSSALAARLLNKSPEEVVGPGTGLDKEGVAHKARVVARALARNNSSANDPLQCLQDLGGLEIASMVGAMLEGQRQRTAVVVDGFISSVAALVASRIDPEVVHHLIFATKSAEPGHRFVIEGIDGLYSEPLLDWGLRLGECSAAALCLPLIRASGSIFSEVATLQQVLEDADKLSAV